jgi:hypothetical protein
MNSDELVEKASDCIYMQMGFDPDGKTVLANGTPYGAWATALAAARAAISAIGPAIRAEGRREGVEEAAGVANEYWRAIISNHGHIPTNPTEAMTKAAQEIEAAIGWLTAKPRKKD